MHTLAEKSVSQESPPKNRLIVSEAVTFETKADSAELHISIKGTSYFADDAAMKKAKEVSTLIDAIKEMGIKDEAIRLKNVVADQQSGIITKTSSAKYFLSIKCSELEKLSEMIAVVTGSKNCELHKLDWHFPEDKQNRLDNIGKAFAAARETALCIASSLGVHIDGVYDCSFEEFVVHEYDGGAGQPQHVAYKAHAVADYESLSMARSRTVPSLPAGQWQKQSIRANVVFRVTSNNGTAASV